MTEPHFKFKLIPNFKLIRENEGILSQLVRLLSLIPERPTEEKFCNYVSERLQEQLSQKPALDKIPLKVDFAWKNHFYVIGKIETDTGGKSFGGEIIYMPEEKEEKDKFRGKLTVITPPDAKSLPDLTKDPRWLEYDHHIKLYQYYLDIALKANMFFYGITGGILAFVYDKEGKGAKFILALLLPIIMSLSLAVVFLYGAYVGREVTYIIRVLKRQLGIKRAPDVQILSLALTFFGIIFFGVSIALVIVLIVWQ